MANEHDIRFIDIHYKELFRIPDGGSIRISYPNHPEWDHSAKCEYIDDYHTKIGGNVFHICEFAEKMKANGAIYKPEGTVSLEQQERLIEAMEVAGMHYDIYDSAPDSLRFTSEMGIVTYFESWDAVTNWIEGTVFDDPDIESEVDEILHPDKYEKAEEMTVLVVEPMKEPYVKTIHTGLEYLQSEVGGMIEAAYPFEDNVGLIMNEEGKLEGLPLNRGLFDEDGHLYDIVAGTFMVVGLTEDDFGSLTPEQIAKYTEVYKQPQTFIRLGNEIKAIPVEPIRPVDSFELFQLRDSDDNALLQFASYDRVARSGVVVSHSNYNNVYSGQLFSGETLDSIYERFNLHHPADFRGHSLSVSDVIVLHKDGKDQAWYVDSFGFKQVPEFLADNPLKKVEELMEDDYGMIDGIINNGDRRKEQEEKKPSVMERLQEKKKEAAEVDAAKPKTPVKDKSQGHELS